MKALSGCLALLLLAMVAPQARAQTVTFSGYATTVPASGLNQPYDVAVDSAGDVYIANTRGNTVVEVTAAGVASVVNVGSPGGTALNYPDGVAVDGAGDVYIADTDNSRVVEVT
ncbi:MAG: hypothetical protein ACP5FH_10565, partial [Terracidiphilus sp.]